MRASSSIAMQIEMQKLREELLKSRRAESARESEVTFLQQQLTEAAKRLVGLTRGGSSGSVEGAREPV